MNMPYQLALYTNTRVASSDKGGRVMLEYHIVILNCEFPQFFGRFRRRNLSDDAWSGSPCAISYLSALSFCSIYSCSYALQTANFCACVSAYSQLLHGKWLSCATCFALLFFIDLCTF